MWTFAIENPSNSKIKPPPSAPQAPVDHAAGSDERDGHDQGIVHGGDGNHGGEVEIDDVGDVHDSIEFDQERADRIANDPGMDVDLVERGDSDFRMLIAHVSRELREEARAIDGHILQIVDSLGGSTGKYRRERGKAARAVLSEIYSPPRVTAMAKMCPSYGILPGFALDLTTFDVDGRRWDFDDPDMQERAWAKIKQEKPLIIVGSPMCTAFSAWQNINNLKRSEVTVKAEMKRALAHLKFCLEIYEFQHKNGRYFLHEHPASASSWGVPEVERLLSLDGVERVIGHQC